MPEQLKLPFSETNRATDRKATFASLLSQLEEAKFLRLFRYLVDTPHVGDRLNRPAAPLDLPDAEVLVKMVGHGWPNILGLNNWIFQISHLPASLWQGQDHGGFVMARLEQAFRNLKTHPQLDRLLKGEQTHNRWDAEGAAPEGSTYYFFTNVLQNLDDQALRRFSDKAHDLFETVTGIPAYRHPEFGMGTPESAMTYSRREVEKFMIDLLNIPSSYYFVAREGRVSIVPTTEHGLFVASQGSRGEEESDPHSIVMTSVLHGRVDASQLATHEELMNAKKVEERELQEFFKMHPQFLFALDERYCELRPHVCLVDQKHERLVPDFMARIEDSYIWDAIELKLPKHPLTVTTGGIERLSSFAARGVAELLQYRDFFAARENRDRVKKVLKTAAYEPCLVLVIGRGRPKHRYEWRSIRAGLPRVQIVSYDYVFNRARECRTALAERGPNVNHAL